MRFEWIKDLETGYITVKPERVETSAEIVCKKLPGIRCDDIAAIKENPTSAEAWADAIINGLGLARGLRREDLTEYLSAFSDQISWES